MTPFDRLFSSRKIIEYVTDKRVSSKSYMKYMLIRLLKMFKYNNLPNTIPQDILETYLLMNGTCFITKVNDSLYAFIGGAGGEPDVYYRPTRYTFANPSLQYSSTASIDNSTQSELNEQQYTIGHDGILVRNDPLWEGLSPLMSRYAALLSENMLTIRSADVMLRAVAMITAPDDKSRIAAEMYLRKLEKGEFGVIGESPFFDGVRLQSPPSNNGSYLTQFIELQQYLKGSFYNEIGLNANFNMKREALNQGETTLNEDSLIPLCESMLQCRKEDMEKVSTLFQLDPPITVEFDSAWRQNMEENDLQLDKLQAEVDEIKASIVSQLREPQESDEFTDSDDNNDFEGGENDDSENDESEDDVSTD